MLEGKSGAEWSSSIELVNHLPVIVFILWWINHVRGGRVLIYKNKFRLRTP